MRRPFLTASGLVLLSAAAAGLVGTTYAESATSCSNLVHPSLDEFCRGLPYHERLVQVLFLLATGLAATLAGLLSRGRPAAAPEPRGVLRQALPGLVVVPFAAVLMVVLSVVLVVVFSGGGQEYFGVPYILAPATLAAGSVLAAFLSWRQGTPAGTALSAVGGGLVVLLGVQVVAEAARWSLDDVPAPLQLSGGFAWGGRGLADTGTVAASALVPVLALALAGRIRRHPPAGAGAAVLGLSALVGSVLLAYSDDGSPDADTGLRWLAVLLAPGLVAAGVLVLSRRGAGRQDGGDGGSTKGRSRERRLAVAAAAGLTIAVGGTAFAVATPPGPSYVLDRWDTVDTAPGELTHVYGPVLGDGCLGSTGVAVAGGRAWTSTDRCSPGDGLPRHVVHELLPDGTARLLPDLPKGTPNIPGGAFDAPPRVVAASGDTVFALDGGALVAFRDGARDWETVVPAGTAHTGDGGPAAEATLQRAVDVDVAADGSLLVAERNSLRRIDANGTITTVAGTNGTYPADNPTWGRGAYFAGPELAGPIDARSTRLPDLTGVAAAPDGSTYLLAADTVLLLSSDGTLRTVVGPDPRAATVDPAVRLSRVAVLGGSPATSLVAALPEPGGALVLDATAQRLLRVGLDGSREKVAGADATPVGTTTGPLSYDEPPFSEDGGQVRDATVLPFPVDAARLPDGDLLLASRYGGVLRLGQ